MSVTHIEPRTRRALEVEPVTPALGAVVRKIDLGGSLGDEDVAAIRRALDEHLVLFFEDQELTPHQQRDLAARFGPLHTHPLYPGEDRLPEIMVLAYDESRRGHNNIWHTDVTFIETPPQASLLYAEHVPPLGGDTLWRNTYLAYEALSPAVQGLIGGLRAVHDFSRAFKPERFAQYGIAERAEKAYRENPPVSHPVVRTNPVTGRKAIFVNENFTSHIEDVSDRESTWILGLLLEHLNRPEFEVRKRWKSRDVAFWDNRWTQHYALSDYFPERRRMRRATILGDRPV